MSAGPAKKEPRETGNESDRFPSSLGLQVTRVDERMMTECEFLSGISRQLLQTFPQTCFEEALKQVVLILRAELDLPEVLLVSPSLEDQSLIAVYQSDATKLLDFSDNFSYENDWLDSQFPEIQTAFLSEKLPFLEVIPFLSGNAVRGVLVFQYREEQVDFVQSLDLAALTEIVQGYLDQVRLAAGSSSESLLRELKLKAMAELAAGAGHEINNPLASISGRAQMLLKQESDLERQQALATIGAQAFRIRDMIGDLMLFGRPPEPDLKPVRLSKVVESVCVQQNQKQKTLPGNKQVTCLDSPEVSLEADSLQLTQVFNALIENGFQAIETEGEVTLSWKPVEGDLIAIEIRDTGTGLTELDREHLFDPFYSGRQAGRGLGFGLSKAWQIARQHQAALILVESSSEGTRFQLLWPGELTPSEPSSE